MEEFINIIGNVGFPMATTAFLLVRLDKKIEELSKAILELNHTLNRDFNSN